MTQIAVKDATGATLSVARVVDTGAADGADSLPVALSNQDKAAVDATNTKLDSLIAAVSAAGPLPSGAATEASLVAVKDSLNVLDDWDEGDRAKVNLVPGQAGVSGGSGAAGASTLRVISATDDPAVLALADLKTSSQAAATSLDALDNWDESSRAKVNLVAGQAGVAAGAGGAGANTLRTVTANDDPLIAQLGATNEGAASSDTATSGLNGLIKRVAQRITSLIALLPASLGAKTSAGSLSVTPATDAAYSAGAPKVASAAIISLTTAAVGTNFTAFGAQACTAVAIVNTNTTAVDLEVRRGASGNTIVVPAGAERVFVGVTNASDLQVRRLDQSNTQVTFTSEALA